MFKPWQLFVLGFTFAMLLGLVGGMDLQDKLESTAFYCDMTAEGSWPAYDEAIDCSYGEEEKR